MEVHQLQTTIPSQFQVNLRHVPVLISLNCGLLCLETSQVTPRQERHLVQVFLMGEGEGEGVRD